MPDEPGSAAPKPEEDYFRERSARADVAEAKRILERAGRGNPVQHGDEIVNE